jgi:proton-dependent oligopeptide transporter, POT family
VQVMQLCVIIAQNRFATASQGKRIKKKNKEKMLKNQPVTKKHPRQLYILSFAELWDRLGYYGTLSILTLFLIQTFGYSDATAYALFGTFTTLSFVTPLLGGILADRYFGQSKTIITGLCLIILGNIILAFTGKQMLYTGLAILICGIGLFKTNNVSMVGHLYPQSDVRKEQGFTILYVGMNLGAMLGPLCYGFLSQRFSFHAGFTLSIVGFSLSLLLYLSQYRYFKRLDNQPACTQHSIRNNTQLGIGTVLVFCCVVLLFHFNSAFTVVIWVAAVATLIGLILLAKKQAAIYRKHIALLVILDFFAMFYLASSMQVMSSVVLFIERCLDTTIFGISIPASTFASLDPFFITLLALFSTPLWLWIAKNKTTPPLIKRVGLGIVFGALGAGVFALLAKSALYTGASSAILILVGANLFIALGELLIGPAIMAAPTNLLPKNLQSTFIGMYFLFNAFAAYLASIFAKFSSIPQSEIVNTHHIYFSAFGTIALITAGAALVYFYLIPRLRNLYKATH